MTQATLEREDEKTKIKPQDYSVKKDISKVTLDSDEIGDKSASGINITKNIQNF